MSVAAAALGHARLRERYPVVAGMLGVAVAAGASGLGGWVAAQLGMKGVVAAAAGLVFVALLILVQRREELILAVAVLSVAGLFHKAFTGLSEISSGPPAIYVTSFDLMIGLLWFAWFLAGPDQMAADLRRALRWLVLWLPIAAGALMVPGVLAAGDVKLAFAELVRMASMYMLYVFFAVHIKTRAQVWIVLGALGAIACVEVVVVAAQYVTSSALGLSVFGTPTILHDRHDGIAIARPFGTMAHPVFMGAFMGPLAIMAYSLGVNLRNRRLKILALAVSVAAVSPLLLASARSASFGIVAAFIVLSIAFMVLGRLPGKQVMAWLLLAFVAAIPTYPYLADLWSSSFHSEHFGLEWESRVELNRVAIAMFEDRPFVGHGLNNFEQALPHYDRYGLIFADNPVHNLYLLQLAETGVVGFVGMLLLAVPLFVLSARLARSKDRLYSAVGFGVAGAFVFWSVEEMFVFSLRQDHPRALFFMFAGLTVACLRLAGLQRPPRARITRSPSMPSKHFPVHLHGPAAGRLRTPWRTRRDNGRFRSSVNGRSPSRHGSPRLRRVRAAVLIVVVVVAGAGFAAAAPTAPASTTDGLKIVFTATNRASGMRGIYTADGDGTHIAQVSPLDGRNYSWASWAFGGSKIVFTARFGDPGGAEPIFIMDADGSDVRQLTSTTWRNVQPQVTPDGRSVVFASAWGEYPAVGMYKLDVETLQVTNLSAVDSEVGALDSDPRVSADGSLIAFANGTGADGSAVPAQVNVVNADGTGRRALTANHWFNTDPALSPDNRSVAIARYVGEGNPHAPGKDQYQVKLHDFVLVVRDLISGAERTLTRGERCFERPSAAPCTPDQGPAFTPRWLPDGTGIGYVSVLSSTRTCVCVVGADGTGHRSLIESDALALNWFDWIVPRHVPDVGIMIGGRVPQSRLLFGGADEAGRLRMAAAMPDRFGDLPIRPRVAGLVPLSARWSRDRSKIVFSALVPFDPATTPPAEAPPGTTRIRHYTLAFMDEFYRPPFERAAAPFEQVFVMNSDGSGVRQLTTPVTEDWMDAVPDGEFRGNSDPDLSPDGHSVVFTNVATATRESFLLRQNLETGSTYNLTNRTSGAMPVIDLQPRFSPDGKSIAFATAVGNAVQIAVIDATDGSGYRELTDDGYLNLAPAWSPDGRYIVYSSYRGPGEFRTSGEHLVEAARDGLLPLDGWSLVRVDTSTGEQVVLTGAADSPAFDAVYSPDGAEIAFISLSGPGLQPDIHVVAAGGGAARPVQVTVLTHELWVDWR